MQTKLRELALTAVGVRENILRMTHAAGSGHPGGSLSIADYLTYLYHAEMNVRPDEPLWAERDRFVLSKGHTAPALYAVLASRGYFPESELLTLRQNGSRLQGHPNMHDTPGVDMSTGSLGQGISVATGMAKGLKHQQRDVNVYTVLGDGECDEGQVWEATMFAAHYGLDNLCIAVDVNGLQIDGATADVMNTASLAEKFTSFGARVTTVDGHSMAAIAEALEFFHAGRGSAQPTVILLRTVKGYGVSYMENVAGWHGKAPSDAELAKGLADLERARVQLKEAV